MSQPSAPHEPLIPGVPLPPPDRPQPPGSRAAAAGRDQDSPRVFISFSSKDIVACSVVQKALEEAEIESWSYPGNIPTAEEWPAILTQRIVGSDVFLLLLSESSNASREVRKEVNLAAKHLDIRMIVFRLDNCKLHNTLEYTLSGLQFANNPTVDWRQELPSMVDAVQVALEVTRKKPRFSIIKAISHQIRTLVRRAWRFSRALTLAVLAFGILVAVMLAAGNPRKWFRKPSGEGDRAGLVRAGNDSEPPVPQTRKEFSPHRYGIVEVGDGGVRALSVETLQDVKTKLLRCDTATALTNESEYGPTLDPATGRFSEASLNRTIEEVRAKQHWLETDQKIAPGQLWIVLTPDLRGWADDDGGVQEFLARLKKSTSRVGGVELVQPAEQAVCLASRIAPRDLDQDTVVIDVGRGNIRASSFDPSNGGTPNLLDTIGTFIPGDRNLNQRLRRRDTASYAQGFETRSKRESLARKLESEAAGTVGRLLSQQAKTSCLLDRAPEVILTGDAVWASRLVADPASAGSASGSRPGPVSPETFDRFEQRVIADGANVYSIPADPRVAEQLQARFSVEELLAASEVLRTMRKVIRLDRPTCRVQFVPSSHWEWLYGYVERRINNLR